MHENKNSVAVSVLNLSKKCGSTKILQSFCMEVKRGTIYGLLGPSGCGKTTVLSAIVGLRKWDSGEVLVFGKPPTTIKRLGYVPQETALYYQLSIREVFTFYGRLNNMTNDEIEESWYFLLKLLDLPMKFKLIGSLSGGQKRRVSLAIALMHCSDGLLILDEPTVGLDPLLRQSVWDHLTKQVKACRTTVIITTHYTEESRLCDKVGVMRAGRMLVEDAPETLLERFRTSIFEKVVLQLCHQDEINEKPSLTEIGRNNNELGNADDNGDIVADSRKSSVPSDASVHSKLMKSSVYESLQRIRGLSTVIILTFTRHPIFLSLILLFPTFHGSITLATIGTKPKGLSFGIVNNELLNWTMKCELPNETVSYLSCYFLNELKQNNLLNLIAHADEDRALDAVHIGRSWGFMVFDENYTTSTLDLGITKAFATNESLEGSRIRTYLDYSQYVGSLFIVKELYTAFQVYARKIMSSLRLGWNEGEMPLNFKTVYGNNEDGYTECLIPGVLICGLFGILAALTSVVFINDRKEGTFSRAQVSGLKTSEFIISHMITQGLVTLVQVCVLSIVFRLFFGFTIFGSIWIYAFICLMSGLCGTALGIFLGAICDNEVESIIVLVFSSPVLLIYGEVFWPLEGTPLFWKRFGYVLPTTLPIVSLRSVISRGLPLTHELVYPGLIASLIWISMLIICSHIVFRKYVK